jgi:23S rRNA (cytosine1962-C5)-methyltransferase
MSLPKIIVGSKKNESIERFHPWVFSGAIKKADEGINEGDIVEVFSNKEKYLATGMYQNGSIAIRLLSWTKEEINEDFWLQRIENAILHRLNNGLPITKENNCMRLVFAEGDLLPGLIIDYYAGTAVMQCHSAGMHQRKDMIVKALQKVLGHQLNAVYDKSAESLHRKDIQNGYIYGKLESKIAQENGISFLIDWEEGQKTGFFVDQRENRKLLGSYAKDKKVMNTFCYTGGFSLYALQNRAREVHSIDSSERAMDLVKENLKINNLQQNHYSHTADVFEFLKNADDDFDIIILDPPAFAKHRDSTHNAMQGYKRLNVEAMRKIKRGGLLFTFSCSQVIHRRLFNDTMLAAAIIAGRKVRVMHHLAQPIDHPYSIFHPEGEYLKGLVLAID